MYVCMSPTSANAIFSGNTKPFQGGFGNLKNRGTSIKTQPGDAYAELYRVREPALDLKKIAECAKEVKHIPGDGCLKSSPVIVRVKNPNKIDTSALVPLVQSLRVCANVRFET